MPYVSIPGLPARDRSPHFLPCERAPLCRRRRTPSCATQACKVSVQHHDGAFKVIMPRATELIARLVSARNSVHRRVNQDLIAHDVINERRTLGPANPRRENCLHNLHQHRKAPSTEYTWCRTLRTPYKSSTVDFEQGLSCHLTPKAQFVPY